MRARYLLPLLLLAPAASGEAQQRPAREWRPAWAADLPYVPPAGTIGIQAFAGTRRPCSIQAFVANATDTTIRDLWGTVLLQPGSIVVRFHAAFIDPQVVRGVPIETWQSCPRGVTRVDLREISPCVRGRSHLKGCGAPVVPYASRMTAPTNAIQVTVAPDFDQ